MNCNKSIKCDEEMNCYNELENIIRFRKKRPCLALGIK